MNLDHAVAVVATATGRLTGKPFAVPPNPYAVAADARSLWVTGLGDETVTRIALG